MIRKAFLTNSVLVFLIILLASAALLIFTPAMDSS